MRAAIIPAERPVTKTELLDCLAWVDALLSAGWMKGAMLGFRPTQETRGAIFPEFHCLVGAVREAVKEVRPTQLRLYDDPLYTTVMNALQAAVSHAQACHCAFCSNQSPESVLMWFNDRQKSVTPVRMRVWDAAENVGSK